MARRYIVTRPATHAPALSEALLAAGFEPVEVPTVTIAPPESWQALDDALRRIGDFEWLLVTSRSGVDALFERAGPAFSWPDRLRWAAIGSGTAGALRAWGIRSVWVPSRFLGEAVAREMPVVRGNRVLRVRAAQASEVPSEGLRARGVEVTDVIAYRTTVAPPSSGDRLMRALTEGAEGVIFTSASTVRGFMQLAEAARVRERVRHLHLVAIGPVTAEAVRAEGFTPHVVASEHSVMGIVKALTGIRAGEGGDQHAARVRDV